MAGQRDPELGFFRSLARIIKGRPEVASSLADNDLLNLILERRSIRSFTSDPISENVVQAILEAGRMAPSGVNLQTWTFIRFSREEWREKFDHPIPFKGQLAIMVLSDLHRVDILREAVDFPNEPLVLHTLAVLNAGLAVMNMTLAAETCGVSSIMLSETGQTGLLDPGVLRDTLDLPENVVPLTTLVLGYRKAGLMAVPPRLPLETICGRAEYPAQDQAVLDRWLAEMKAGYRAMRPWSSLEAQLRVYRRKIHRAEEDLREMVFGTGFE
jgi:nitroreductase